MGFLKNERLIDEDHRVDDDFDFNFVTKKTKHIIDIAPDKSIICLVGPYGSGKSTVLHQIEKTQAKINKNNLWFEFEAWKFPERKDLWENFVLEMARIIDEKTFREFEKKIDGKDDKKALIDTIGGIPGAGGVRGLKHFLRTSPATRTYQIQKILNELINRKLKPKNLTIIIEDIDRSGDAGIFFLETLKSYLVSQDRAVEASIKCVVPVETKKFEENLDSYLKCTDIIERFRPSKPKLSSYLDKLLKYDVFDETARHQTVSFCEELFSFYQDDMTPRKLKHILRLANTKYESMQTNSLNPDGRLCIATEATKLLHQRGSQEPLYLLFLREERIVDNPFSNFCKSIVFGVDYSDRRVIDSNIRYSINPQHEELPEQRAMIPWHDPAGPEPITRIRGHFPEIYFDY